MFSLLSKFSLPALCLVSLASISFAQEAELLANANFQNGTNGCLIRDARVAERKGPKKTTAVVLPGVVARGTWSNIGFRIQDPPLGRRLNFSVSLFAEEKNQQASINVFAYAKGRVKVKSWSEQISLRKSKWQSAEESYVLPAEVELLEIFIINQGKNDVFVAAPSLLGGKEETPTLENLTAPGILLASASVTVRKDPKQTTGLVIFPIPIINEHQVPLTFDLVATPSEALLGYKWVLREDGRNWLCEAEVDPSASNVTIRWESLVLVDKRKNIRLPKSGEAEVPKEAAPWLRATAVIQSDDEAIVAKAKELGAQKDDVEKYVKSVLEFTSTNQGKPGVKFQTLDASAAVDCGGSCTSRANLAAALFRDGGIPARTSAHLPTWSGPLYEHWHVEYWHPQVGWTWVEPTLGAMRPQPYSMVVINVANPEDEDQGFDPVIANSGVMTGVPRHAVHELSPNLRSIWNGSDKASLNYARAIAHLDGSSSSQKKLFTQARLAWKVLMAENLAGKANSERRAAIDSCFDSEMVKKKRVTKSLLKHLDS